MADTIEGLRTTEMDMEDAIEGLRNAEMADAIEGFLG
jgi:hypothetical protein